MPLKHGADLGEDLREDGLAERQYGDLLQKAAPLAQVELVLQSFGDQPIVEAYGRCLVQPVIHEP